MQYETVELGPKSAVTCGFITVASGSEAGSQKAEQEKINEKNMLVIFQ